MHCSGSTQPTSNQTMIYQKADLGVHIREPAKDFVYDRKNGDRFLIFRMAIGAPPPSFYHLSKHSIGSAF
jgi:hypothetical protein